MLNHSNLGKNNEREFSVWVGDLDKSVDDSQLYMAFASRYSSVVAARGKFGNRRPLPPAVLSYLILPTSAAMLDVGPL